MTTLPGSRSAVSVPARRARQRARRRRSRACPEMFSRSTRSVRSTAAVARAGPAPPPRRAPRRRRRRRAAGGRRPRATAPPASAPLHHFSSSPAVDLPGPIGDFSHAFCAAWNLADSGFRPLPSRICAPPFSSNVGSGNVDAVLAHAARVGQRRLLELLLLLVGHLGRLDLPRGTSRTPSRRRASAPGSAGLAHPLRHPPALELRVGHVDAVLAHAAGEVEHRLAVLGLLGRPDAEALRAPPRRHRRRARRSPRGRRANRRVFIPDISPGGHETAFSRT